MQITNKQGRKAGSSLELQEEVNSWSGRGLRITSKTLMFVES